MEREFFITMKEANTLDNGDKIRWMARESFITLIIKLLMMVNGRKTNYKDMGHSIMRKLGH